MINFEYIDYIEDDKDLESTSKEQSSEEVSSSEGTPMEDASAEESLESTPAEEVSSDSEVSNDEASKGKDEQNSKADVNFVFTNIIGKKIGMTQLFSEEGNVFPATIIKAGPCSVTQVKSLDNDGYKSVQIGYDDIVNKSKSNKATLGHFSKSNTTPKRVLKEFRVYNDRELPQLGDVVDVKQFNPGEYVTVTGYSIGKGFAGHMKRHGFGGGRASHGKNSVMRKSGSVGAGTSPGRIFPGMKMAGRMGNDRVTIKNLQILDIDYSSNLIFVKGSVPGSKNNYVYLRKN